MNEIRRFKVDTLFLGEIEVSFNVDPFDFYNIKTATNEHGKTEAGSWSAFKSFDSDFTQGIVNPNRGLVSSHCETKQEAIRKLFEAISDYTLDNLK